jgi:hypothetical protein
MAGTVGTCSRWREWKYQSRWWNKGADRKLAVSKSKRAIYLACKRSRKHQTSQNRTRIKSFNAHACLGKARIGNNKKARDISGPSRSTRVRILSVNFIRTFSEFY